MSKNSPIRMKLVSSRPIFSEADRTDNALAYYLKEITQYPSLSPSEERLVAKRVQEGDVNARLELIEANLKLVVALARKTIHTSGIPFVDLIQEGNMGLMVAVDRFDYKLGYKFATYASWWIKQFMFKAISEQSHCMKIPVYIQETLSKYSKIKSEMEKTANEQVRTEDVAKKMNISADKIDTFLSAYTKTISIESGLEKADGKELNVADIIADEKTSVSENVEYESLKSDIEMVVSTLKERERNVVTMRYGLGNTSRKTLEEIGNMYGVTKECIRQTELRALKKMKISGQDILAEYIA